MHECKICGEQFAGIGGDELKKAASRHIWDEHSDHPNPDEPIVVEK
jgi:hypothetical protein